MCVSLLLFILFFFTDPAPTEIYTLSLHDALPISELSQLRRPASLYALAAPGWSGTLASRTASFGLKSLKAGWRSEEHTSELQSHSDLVCRLLLEKKKKNKEE